MATGRICLALAWISSLRARSVPLMQLCEWSPAAAQRGVWESCRSVPREACWSGAPNGPARACWHSALKRLLTLPSCQERDDFNANCLAFVCFYRAFPRWLVVHNFNWGLMVEMSPCFKLLFRKIIHAVGGHPTEICSRC